MGFIYMNTLAAFGGLIMTLATLRQLKAQREARIIVTEIGAALCIAVFVVLSSIAFIFYTYRVIGGLGSLTLVVAPLLWGLWYFQMSIRNLNPHGRKPQ
jgi:hypothetical protein